MYRFSFLLLAIFLLSVHIHQKLLLILLLFLKVRPPRPQSVFIIGWWYSNPRTAAKRSLDSVPLNLVYYFPSIDGSGPPLLPPPRFTWVPCPLQFARILSLSPLLPPLHLFLFLWSFTSSSVWSPVVRPGEVYNPPSDCRPMPSPGFLSSVPYENFPPLQPVLLAILGLGVGGGA